MVNDKLRCLKIMKEKNAYAIFFRNMFGNNVVYTISNKMFTLVIQIVMFFSFLNKLLDVNSR